MEIKILASKFKYFKKELFVDSILVVIGLGLVGLVVVN